jgi:hypothetical protein
MLIVIRPASRLFDSIDPNRTYQLHGNDSRTCIRGVLGEEKLGVCKIAQTRPVSDSYV